MYDARRKLKTPVNPSGLCMCGCGQPTPISKHNHPERGYYAGQHIRYLPGHAERLKTGPNASNWKGGRHVHKSGYVYIYAPNHPAANRDHYVFEHRLVAEKELGRFLEFQERVHHINGIKGDNRLENLIVMQTHSKHMQLPEHTQGLQNYYKEHPEKYAEHGQKGAHARWDDP